MTKTLTITVTIAAIVAIAVAVMAIIRWKRATSSSGSGSGSDPSTHKHRDTMKGSYPYLMSLSVDDQEKYKNTCGFKLLPDSGDRKEAYGFDANDMNPKTLCLDKNKMHSKEDCETCMNMCKYNPANGKVHKSFDPKSCVDNFKPHDKNACDMLKDGCGISGTGSMRDRIHLLNPSKECKQAYDTIFKSTALWGQLDQCKMYKEYATCHHMDVNDDHKVNDSDKTLVKNAVSEKSKDVWKYDMDMNMKLTSRDSQRINSYWMDAQHGVCNRKYREVDKNMGRLAQEDSAKLLRHVTSSCKAADIYRDETVNVEDTLVFLGKYGCDMGDQSCNKYDVNKDGKVDTQDTQFVTERLRCMKNGELQPSSWPCKKGKIKDQYKSYCSKLGIQ